MNSSKIKILLHVNYHEGAGRLRNLFKLASDNGYDGVELRWKYRFPDMDQTKYQTEVASLKAAHPGMEIVFGGCVNFCRGTEEEVRKDTENYLEFMDWAARECGTKVMNFFTGGLVAEGNPYYNFHTNGSAIANEDDYRKSAEGLRTVGDRAQRLGMLIALETHNCYLHDLPDSCRKLLDMTAHDAVGINYDQGNIILNSNGCSPDAVVEKLHDKIYYAHLKNMLIVSGAVPGFLCTRLDAGHINTLSVVEKIKEPLRSGMLALEYPNPGDGIYAAAQDMAYMRFIKDYLNLE